MLKSLLSSVVLSLWLLGSQLAGAVSPTAGEMAEPSSGWRQFRRRAETKAPEPFFSFTYGGKPSAPNC